jgi:hypothetical protein
MIDDEHVLAATTSIPSDKDLFPVKVMLDAEDSLPFCYECRLIFYLMSLEASGKVSAVRHSLVMNHL